MLNSDAPAQAQNRDRSRLRTGEKANAATGATSAVVCRGPVPEVIQTVTQMNGLWRARLDTQPTALALVPINSQQAPISLRAACHFRVHRFPLNPSTAVPHVCSLWRHGISITRTLPSAPGSAPSPQNPPTPA